MFAAFRHGAVAQVADVIRVLTGREPRTFTEFVREHRAAFG
jgi:hypothetical protein